jgi:hypothetical protein
MCDWNWNKRNQQEERCLKWHNLYNLGPELLKGPPTRHNILHSYVGIYIPLPVRLHGVVLNYFSTGTTLPFLHLSSIPIINMR